MSHPEQLAFFEAVVRRSGFRVTGAKILEIGSYDVNGSLRRICESAAEYVGVDLTEGPGVDLVCYGQDVDHPDGTYDMVISGECFEHDPHWERTLANMVRMTRPGGLVVFTCASHGRPEHGTRRSDVTDSPGTQAHGSDYYRNLTSRDFAPLPLDAWFDKRKFWNMPTTFDLYFVGVRSGAKGSIVFPSDEDIAKIRRLLPWSHRLVRLPLRLLATLIQDEDRYQRVVMPYWLFLLRRSARHQRAARTTSA